MYKIYFDSKVLYLTDKNTIISDTSHEYSTKENLESFINNFLNSSFLSFLIYFEDVELLFSEVLKCFKYIEAAGGFVLNDKDQLLIMFRKGKWDLPKGKIDKGETIKCAAIREVQEETGLNQLEIGEELPSSYHIYFHKNKYVLKRTYWFKMLHLSNEKLVPQYEEDITELKWLSKDRIVELFENSYQTIIDVCSSSDW